MAPAKRQKLCFVIMPFHEGLRPVYEQAIKPACQQTGFAAVRVDEVEGVYNINRQIIEHLFKSDVIIADLTDWRPNVFYELGVAHAIANKTIMIINQKDQVPFDVKIYRCLLYESGPDGLAKLTAELASALASLEDWQQQPANPVQDHHPTICLPQKELQEIRAALRKREVSLRRQDAAMAKLQAKLAEKDRLLRSTNDSLRRMRKQRQRQDRLLQAAPTADEIEKLKAELAQRRAEITALQKEIKKLRARAAGAWNPPAA